MDLMVSFLRFFFVLVVMFPLWLFSLLDEDMTLMKRTDDDDDGYVMSYSCNERRVLCFGCLLMHFLLQGAGVAWYSYNTRNSR